MNKRYQILIGSAVSGFEDEKKSLAQTVLDKGYYLTEVDWLSGMNEVKFKSIKRSIDDSDYYILILGGLYGIITADGKSYTEKAYDYALKKGKTIIALVQKNPDITENDSVREEKFTNFYNKVINTKPIHYWKEKKELTSQFSIILDSAIREFPMQGWIRCNSETCEARLEFIDMSTKISSLKIDKIKTIHIMASGTSSYIPLVKNLLKINKQKKVMVDIYIYFRLGHDPQRVDSFMKQFDRWWNILKKEYPKLRFHFICVKDFKVSFRGIIINREIGLIGFYIRMDGTTIGTLEDCIYIDKTTNVGRYILSCCLKCFKGQKEYSTLKNCVENSI